MHKCTLSYLSNTSAAHKKKFGQYFTQDNIATLMIQWILQNTPKTIYDPAFGMGAFYYQAKDAGFNGRFIGTEIDVKVFEFFMNSYKSNTYNQKGNLELKNQDYFLNWKPNAYEAIVCNPPYMRFQKFSNRKLIIDNLSKHFNENLSGYTNIASAFLAKSLLELTDNGRLAYILPFEFLNSGYGKTIKKLLLTRGTIENIIKIEDETNTFSNVTTTICIIFYEKKLDESDIVFSKIKSVNNIYITKCNSIKKNKIDFTKKWSMFFDTTKIYENINTNFVSLSHYGKFVRGIATGCNDYFLLNRADIASYHLDLKYFSLCISKSNQATQPFFEKKHLMNLSRENKPIYLLNICKMNISEEIRKYIKYGEQLGINKRYLTKTRSPWYSIEHREPAPIWFGVFSRGNHKIIRNQTNSVTLSCYHSFYPNPLFTKYIDFLYIYLLSEVGAMHLKMNQRIYGNQLIKFEPNDLNNVLVPSIASFEGLGDDFLSQQLLAIKQKGNLTHDGETKFRSLLHS